MRGRCLRWASLGSRVRCCIRDRSNYGTRSDDRQRWYFWRIYEFNSSGRRSVIALAPIWFPQRLGGLPSPLRRGRLHQRAIYINRRSCMPNRGGFIARDLLSQLRIHARSFSLDFIPLNTILRTFPAVHTGSREIANLWKRTWSIWENYTQDLRSWMYFGTFRHYSGKKFFLLSKYTEFWKVISVVWKHH